MTRTVDRDAVAGQLRPVRAVGQDLRGPLQRDVALEPDQHVRGPDHPGDPGGSVVVAVHQPDPVRREQERELFHGLIQQGLLRLGLVRAGGPVRHREQRPARAAGQRQRPQARVRAAVITGAHGAEERPVRGRVRHPDQRPVQRSRLQRPLLPDGHRTRAAPAGVLPPGRSQHQVPQLFQGNRAERVPPVPGRPRRRRHATAAPTAPAPGPRPARRSRPRAARPGRVGSGRPARIAPGGFPRSSRRTRRAALTAPGAPCALAAGSAGWPG